MDKKIKIIIAIIVAAIVGAGLYVALAGSKETTAPEQRSETAEVESKVQDDPDMQVSDQVAVAGSYVDYDEKAVGETQGTKLLFFHAPWCSQCRELEADIKARHFLIT